MNQDRPSKYDIPVRYNNPTRLDIARYGALVKVVREDGSMELFIQTSADLEHCNWITVGELLAQTEIMEMEDLGNALCHYTNMIEVQKRKARLTLLL